MKLGRVRLEELPQLTELTRMTSQHVRAAQYIAQLRFSHRTPEEQQAVADHYILLAVYGEAPVYDA